MEAVLSGSGLKIFARNLRFMARIGNEFFFEATSKAVILRVVNNSKTCLCSISFPDVFFTQYKTGKADLDNNCFVSARPLLQVLRNIKTVVNCRIQLDVDKERLIVDILKLKGIRMVNTITLLDNDEIDHYEPPKKANDNKIVCQPQILNNILTNIPKNLRELGIKISKQKLEVRNHINHPDQDVQTVRLFYQLDPSEFTTYEVSTETELIVTSQDFLSLLELAEKSSDDLRMEFSQNGKPLVASLETSANVKVQMVMATLKEETLKHLRKPSGVTSYKELMGSYIEGRLSAQGNEHAETSLKLNDTVFSPSVDTFASKKGLSRRDSIQAATKRKSDEMGNKTVANDLDQSKKQRMDEQQNVSHLLKELERKDMEEEAIIIEDDDPSPNHNFLQDFTEQNNLNKPEMVAESEGIRLPINAANLESESTPSVFHKSSETSNLTKSSRKSTASIKKKSRFLERQLFGAVFKAKQNHDQNFSMELYGKTLIENSDSSTGDEHE